jgi:acyl-CoA reductase-like NAD-dependent aldehyde dehydrogenase
MTLPLFPTIRQFIGGDWTDGADAAAETVLDPATGETLAVFRHAGEADVAAALDAARCTASAWRATAPDVRYRLLREAARCT